MKNLIMSLVIFAFCSINVLSQADKPVVRNDAKPEVKMNNLKTQTAEEVSKTALNVGANMPAFELPNAKNELVSSAEMMKEGSLVLVFYRGAWCPFCNTYLRTLEKNLEAITANGGKLIAISVENPDISMTVATKNEVTFTVLSDKNLDLARKFGIVYQLAAETNEKYKGFGVDLVKQNGTETPDLPLSATYIVNKSGEIVYAFLDPDYKKRAEPGEIIKILEKIKEGNDSMKMAN